METNLILERFDRLEELLFKTSEILFKNSTLKSTLNVEDLIDYTGFKRSYIYKLVHLNEIPYYKPQGKMLFFDREEIDQWLRQNKSQSKAQIENKALDYFFKSKK